MFESNKLYNESGFKKEDDAKQFIQSIQGKIAKIANLKKSKQKENAPLLFNLAEIQNEAAKRFKIKPDETLEIIQNLYEKKLVTYPRTDARVLSTAVAKVISKNLNGLAKGFQDEEIQGYLKKMAEEKYSTNLLKTKYVNDSKITDHYAIIPTGQGFENYNQLPELQKQMYKVIVKRFLSIFYPPAVYQKVAIVSSIKEERFFSNFKVLAEEGYLKVAGVPKGRNTSAKGKPEGSMKEEEEKESGADGAEEEQGLDTALFEVIKSLKKGAVLPVRALNIKEGETSPPKRYNSGSIILAMENAGQLIEDEELRAQIKGSGIGTSATRAEILKKLINIKYLSLNKKTQVITPTLQGEMVYDVVDHSIKSLLNPELTASWEKGLNYVAEGTITSEEYMQKLDHFVTVRTVGVKGLNNQYQLRACYDHAAAFYKRGRK